MTGMRVRFAPSPTGHLHVGNVRTALFNWLLARHHGGTFVLRIEDTDVERSTAASDRAILEDLRWLGLDWDEGPDRGGAAGPYRQSERGAFYAETAERLRAEGRAYYCFCTAADLEARRQAAIAAGRAPMYDGRCRALDPADAARRAAAGEPAAVRFAVERDGAVTFDDLVRGPVTVESATIGDPVIVRSGGGAAYNFAVVVDDARMGITHVVRGEDHLSNTPRQILIYRALGVDPPAFAHLSLVLGPDHAPLSKRHGATSVIEFRDGGVLPEALVNYLALLGWSPGGDEEIVPLSEMARRFDLADVGHSASVFDTDKLAWMNRQYMRAAAPDRIVGELLPYLRRRGLVTGIDAAGRAYLAAVLPLAVGSVDRVSEIPDRLAFVFDWDAAAVAGRLRDEPDGVTVARAFARAVATRGPLDREGFRAAAAEVRGETRLTGRALFHPIRVLLTGEDSGPELDLAVPAIDAGAALAGGGGLRRVMGCRARAEAVVRAFDAA